MIIARWKMCSALTRGCGDWGGRTAFVGGEGNRESLFEKETVKPRPKC